MAEPLFSVLVTAYNRAGEVQRCLRSCFEQGFAHFEVVVVDDGSSDETPSVLARLADPRLRVISHPSNRGMSAARATAAEHARGEWCVLLDSDDELMPGALARLRSLIDTLPPEVRIIRTRVQLDDGSVNPKIMPATAITGYTERLLWLESVALTRTGTDASHSIHRSVLAAENYIAGRAGEMTGLWELNIARHTSSLWVSDVLWRVHSDAVNSDQRDASAARVVPRLLREAPDMQWMFETMIADHGVALALHAPTLWRGAHEGAAVQAFLSGHRATGVGHAATALRGDWANRRMWAALALGLIGPRALAYAKTIRRGSRARRRLAAVKRVAAA
jgi:Glycosyl transferase family 2